jgi:VanZ family protein
LKKQKGSLAYKRRLWHWGPVVIWMVIIFIGSSHANVVLSETHDNSMKNLAHIGEYAILAFLIFRALYNREEKGFFSKYAWFWAFAGATLYGVSDEIHQMFVPTRTAYLGDILMDGVGAGVGLLFGIIVYTSLSGKFLAGKSKK